MLKKLMVGLLGLVILLGPVSGLRTRPAVANTGPKILLCAAEPWHDDFPGANNSSPPDTSGLSTIEAKVKMQNTQQSSIVNRPDSRTKNFLYRILHTLWGMIFPESF